jgi:hypothetical protein
VQSGTYNITFYASDGILTDSEQVTITVLDAGNQTPVLATIGSQSVNEGANLNFQTTATDLDGTIPFLTTSTLPTGATYIDNADGTADFDWTPDFTQSGTYSVTFYATDGLATDSEIVSISVNEAGNQDPVLATIGAQGTTEGTNLSFSISATDLDGTIPALSSSTLPTGATLTIIGDGTADFSWTPDFTQSGTYVVTFYATDGIAIDSEVVSISINEAGNQTPVLATIGSQSVTENVNLNFNTSATDLDGTIPALSTTTLPTGATYIDNADGTGTFNWTPDFTQSGSYNVTFYATDGVAIDSEVVAITVNEAGNQDPVLATIGSQSVTEGNNLNFATSATDLDGTIPTLTTSTLPIGATYIDNADGTGTFDFNPSFTQAGSYDVTFYATDGLATDSEVVTITVNEAGNQTPVLAAIGPQSITESNLLSFALSATDDDLTIPSFNSSALPTGATFTDNGDGTASFDWTPDFTQSGSYDITFRATDGLATDSEVVTITVNDAGNQDPILATIGPQGANEGDLLSFPVSATDPDGTIPALSSSTLPTGAIFTDNGNGTASFDWTPDFSQSGSYNVTFYATDGLASDSEEVLITINELGNQTPVLATIGPKSTTEDVLLNFNMSATDDDLTIPTFSATGIPTGATLTDNLDGTATFDWTPTFLQSGSYDVTFIASDGSADDSEVVTITVNEAGNQLPVLTTIGDQTVTEGLNLNFDATATDVDGTLITLTTSTLPSGATFTDNADGTANFDWTPTFTQSGSYSVTFYATDDSLAIDSEIVSITVNEAGNQDPVLATIGSQSVTEGNPLNIAVSATDLDQTIPTLSTSTLPTGATFVDNTDGTANFDWTPGFTQAGSYFVIFYATDGLATDSEVVSITVNEAGNQPPVLATIGPQSVIEGNNLNFNASATDLDETIPTLSTSTLPTGATFIDNANGTATFDWTPDFTQV